MSQPLLKVSMLCSESAYLALGINCFLCIANILVNTGVHHPFGELIPGFMVKELLPKILIYIQLKDSICHSW